MKAECFSTMWKLQKFGRRREDNGGGWEGEGDRGARYGEFRQLRGSSSDDRQHRMAMVQAAYCALLKIRKDRSWEAWNT
jgi:hypothetical protein